MLRQALFLVLLLAGGLAPAAPLQCPKPGAQDTCPVCGMFVAKYRDWVASVAYRDGHAHFFDGAKDLFKYLLDLPRWAPGHRSDEIGSIGVTDYYGLSCIDAREARFVIGSDVLGPMGHELIPLTDEAAAGDFIKDHGGRRVLGFEEVTPALLEGLDAGRFE